MRLTSALLATTLLSCAALFGSTAHAQDAAIKRQLDALGHDYEIDDDGDYKMTFEVDDGRTQLVFVISNVETYGSHRVREVWAPAYRAEESDFPALVANRLLQETMENKLGAWAKQDDMAVYVVKISADAPDDELNDAIEYAAQVADRMEVVLTDGEDEF
ncbi:YbjN domain-containing protein [Marilutibacter chinensis]|uniref:YbjN domain-containing protein n=1 Tax=Marilutibacter chinensis TaxID=2912247 RepID=A0ABS9HMT4_9GAMM|nr:YbjN domain-containing protein [Lysobacter chinensis]MCF7220329.1 YbjN domain-containing protein [Lysobacter chinensis]